MKEGKICYKLLVVTVLAVTLTLSHAETKEPAQEPPVILFQNVNLWDGISDNLQAAWMCWWSATK